MELLEAILERRSVRSYTQEKVDRVILDGLVEAGRWAPTASNAQPWAFIVVDDSELIVKLKSISPGIFCIPAFIIMICSNSEIAALNGAQGETLALMDVSMAAQNILLAAHAQGIGTCVVRSFHQKAAAVLLGCPEGILPELLIAGGYPDKKPSIPPRKKLDEIRYFNRWESK